MKLSARIKKKLNNKAGFTLTELLLAVLILLMVSTIVAAGIPAAREAYENVVLASNAEILLSTTIATLRNEVGSASDLEIPGGTVNGDETTGSAITYYNTARGFSSEISMDSGGTDIQFVRYFEKPNSVLSGILPIASTKENLISDRTATNDLHVTYDTVSYNSRTGVVKFSKLSVFHGDDDTPLTHRDNVYIKVITEG